MAKVRMIALGAVSLTGLAAMASAQSAAPPTVPAPGAATEPSASGLAEIVVTARRRVESAQDIPVSVTAISGQRIERMDLTSLEKISAMTPQFQVGRASNGSGAQLTLRGIGSSSTSIGIEQSVAVVVDGVYYGSGRIINEGFFDLSRVEILKGPQALFFGKNATAGVVNIVTADPGDKFELKARAAYEFTAKQPLGEVEVSTPLTETLGVRAAVRYSNMLGGYFTTRSIPFSYPTTDVATGTVSPHTAFPTAHRMPGEEELIGRVTLKWQPVDRLTVTLKGSIDRNDVNNNSWNYIPYWCPGGVAQINPADRQECSKTKFQSFQMDMPADIAKTVAYAGTDGLYNKYRSGNVTGTINYVLDDITLTSINNFSRNVNKWQCNCAWGQGGTWATERSTFRQVSTENRVQTNFDAPVNLMGGILYQNTHRFINTNIVFANIENSRAPASQRYLGYMSVGTTDGETVTGYGQVTWKIIPKIEATAGVRYTHETKDSFFVHPYVNPAFTVIFVPNKTLTANQVFTDWSPEVTISYKPTRDINIYAAYKTAYKSGGFSVSGIYSANSLTPYDDMAFDPEKARGFEAGIKTTLFDRQLRFNVGLFRYKYSNLQVDFFNSPIFAFQTINAGNAITKGVETEFEYAPRALPGLTLRGALNYDSAKYKNFQGPCYAGQTLALGCTLIGPSGAPFQDLSGKPTAVAPKWTGTLGIGYEGALNAALRWGLSVDTRYSSSYYASGFNQPESRVARYATIDASARIRTANDRWELAVIGKNLTNRLYITAVQDRPGTGGPTGQATGTFADQIGYANIPRTVMLQGIFHY